MDEDRYVETALELGVITKAQVAEAEKQRRTLADRGIDRSVWFLLQDLGIITDEQARRVRRGMSSSVIKALDVAGYVLEGRLGSGGMGDVFRGRNAAGEIAAVKLLSSKFARNQEYRRRFEREARAAQRLVHPNVCKCMGSGEAAGTRYLIMEVVEGPSLKGRLVENGPITEVETLAVLEQMAEALGHAWKHGVLHRDVKPANILLGTPRPGMDEPFCAKLIDFGLAKVWQDEEHTSEDSHGGLTAAGLALGTPHYMSPEQASGLPDLDQRCDIYGLGASMYHAMLGHTLYSGKSSAVIMYKQVSEVLDLSELRRQGARENLVRLLERMLAKDRAKRIATWEEVLAEVRRIRTKLVHGPSLPGGASGRLGALVGGWRWWHTATAAAALIAMGAGIWALRGEPPTGTPTAEIAVTPESWKAALDDHPVALALAPGTYPALRLGAMHQGLTLRGEGTGVLFRAVDGPSLNVEAGARKVTLRNLTFAGGARIAAGSDLAASEVTVLGQAQVNGGKAELDRCTIQDGLQVDHGGIVDLQNCTLTGQPALRVEDGVVHGVVCRFTGPVLAKTGELHLKGCAILADQPQTLTAALVLERIRGVRLEDTRITGGNVAIQASGAILDVFNDCILTARTRGLVWLGPVDATWPWGHITIDAPETASGLPPALVGRLARINH